MTTPPPDAEKTACPECEALRKERIHLRAIAEEAAKLSDLIHRHGANSDEVVSQIHALDFELIEYTRWDDSPE